MKTCSKCKIEKPANAEYFHRNKNYKDGLSYQCKDCHRGYRKQAKAKNKKKRFIYDDKKVKECNECKMEKPAMPDYFYKDIKMKDGLANECKECTKKRRQNNYKENREKILEEMKKYHLENPEVSRLSSQRRRARIAELPHDLTPEEWHETLEYFNNECAYCGDSESGLHQEHVIPVFKGGGYTQDNIIPACKSCNSSKHARDMKEWYSEQEFFNIGRFILLNEWIEAGIGESERVAEEEK